MANNGVLLLAGLAELKKSEVEVLWQPLEHGVVTILRAAMSLTHSAGLTLPAAMQD